MHVKPWGDDGEKMNGVCRCDICGAEMKQIFLTVGDEIYQCPACKLVKLSGPDIAIGSTTDLDEEKRKKSLQDTRNNEFSRVLEVMRTCIPKGSYGLDIGCSYGDFIAHICADYDCVGVEPEAAVASQAISMGRDVTIGFFPEAVSQKYDFLVFNNVFEHITQCNDLLDACREHLNPGGYILITVPYTSGVIYKIASLFVAFGRNKEMRRLYQLDFQSPHVYYYNKKNLVRLLARHGFNPIAYQRLNAIAPRSVKDRIQMDKKESAAGFKAFLFRLAYPIIRILPEDKGLYIFKDNIGDGPS